LTCPSCGGRTFERETNILDVWFDSGSSHEAVLPFNADLTWPADMYLEGSDQHRGWFQSSLLVGLGTRGRPPFREVLTHGFLIDVEGQKMSKSLGNTIGIDDPAEEMFGKLMSISDTLMWRYFELLSAKSLSAIAKLRQGVDGGANPRDAKFELAAEIVDRYHGAGAGARERERFIARFRDGAVPEDVPETVIDLKGDSAKLANVLKEAGLAASASAAYRLIEQGAVRVDGERISSRDAVLPAGSTVLIQAGKRGISRVTLRRH
jgi:tyrosyl-tRNA synthetase